MKYFLPVIAVTLMLGGCATTDESSISSFKQKCEQQGITDQQALSNCMRFLQEERSANRARKLEAMRMIVSGTTPRPIYNPNPVRRTTCSRFRGTLNCTTF